MVCNVFKIFSLSRFFEWSVQGLEGSPTTTQRAPSDERKRTEVCETLKVAMSSGRDSTLWDAARDGCVETVLALLQAGADPNDSNERGITPIWYASQNGHAHVVQPLLQRGAAAQSVALCEGVPIPAIWIAAQEGHADVARLLLGAGADPNATRGSDGCTTLWQPVFRGHLDVVRLLLEGGADPNVGDGNTRSTPLMNAASMNRVEETRLLLKSGANVDASQINGYTALLHAAFEGHVEVARILLQAGADVDHTNNQGHTPLHVALRKKQKDVALLLLRHGACLPDSANFSDAIRMVEWLVDAGTEREASHAAEVARLRLDVQSLQDGIPYLLQAAMGHAHR